MAGKTIEAILRIAADVSGGLAGLRQLREESKATAAAVAGASRADGSGSGADPATEAKKRNKALSEADAQALAEKKAALRAQREAERRAARERRDDDEKERRARRRAEADDERQRTAQVAARQRAEREQKRQLTMVAPQLTDIATGLASGQNPALVALQQGGQLRDIFGGFGNAARAVMSVLTPMRLLVGGIGAGLATWAVQIYAGAKESERLRHSLALTGNAAGTSQGQITALAKGIATETQNSIGFTRELMAQLINVSGQTASTLGATGRAAAALAKLTGESAEESVKAFDGQADGITAWATKANRAYNFLTAAQVAYVRDLERQGRVQEAIRFVNDELANTLIQRTGPALGMLERAWSAVGRAVSGVLDAMKELGRDDTPEQALAKIERRLRQIKQEQDGPQFRFFGGRPDLSAERGKLEDQQRALYQGQLRGAEQAAQKQAELEKIKDDSLERQQARNALALAQGQKALQDELALLDRRQQAVELADAQGLMGAREKALALNRIEQQRLRAQLVLQRQQAAAAAALVGKQSTPEAALTAQAQATEAQAQLVATQARLGAALADARRIVAADDLAKSRERAQAWADIWLRASERVREFARDNADADAAAQGDPMQRAQMVARARTADLQRQLDDMARDLRVQIGLSIDPGQKAELERLLTELQAQGGRAVDNAARQAALGSLREAAQQQMDELKLKEDELAEAVRQRALTSEEAERRVNAAREQAMPALLRMVQAMKALARTDAERLALAQLEQQIRGVTERVDEMRQTVVNAAQSGLATLWVDFVTGAKTAKEALRDFAAGFARTMLDLMAKRLAERLVNQAMDALEQMKTSGGSSGGNWWGAVLQWIGTIFATSKHTGGVIGGVGGNLRRVSPWVFQGAQVLHGGGIAGLMPNEVPAVLERGEEVLTADDPRHRRNMGRGSGPLIGNFNVAVSMEGVASGSGDDAMARRLAAMLKSAIEQKLAEEMRPGGMLQGAARA